jgi:succinyl-CoA synthetase beta subunit
MMMKIHEYQAKALFRQFDIPTSMGEVTTDIAEVPAICQRLLDATGVNCFVVKAQIHAGGRGKGGGVKVTFSPEDAQKAAQAILGMQLVTPQTGPEGKQVNQILIESGSDIEREIYTAILLDRETSRPVLIVSPAGGMDIEEVAATEPEKIYRTFIHPALGLQTAQAREMAYRLNLPKEATKQATAIFMNLYRMFIETDAAMVEINPLILTKDGHVRALDAKVSFDANALYRHPEIAAMRDLTEEDALEVEASEHHLNYIKLDGNVGCMVNGAGLAMATMDLIKLHGAFPANFLDVGGGANAQAIENAFRIIQSDENVKVIFINIFGGILRCDLLAEGVVAAAKKQPVQLPIVIRMKGTNVEKGKQILAESGLKYAVAEELTEAAEKVIAFVG